MRGSLRGLFITGTDTEVGKTYVAALVARQLRAAGHRVGVYKPAASGCRFEQNTLVSDDAVALWEAAGRPAELDRVCPQRFAAPLAPHLAARAEGKELDAALLAGGIDYWHTSDADIVLVEGVGGLMCPLGDDQPKKGPGLICAKHPPGRSGKLNLVPFSAPLYIADLALELGFPLVVVSRNSLGTINHTLQTLWVAKTYRGGLDVAGVVLNHPTPTADDPSTASNRAQLATHCRVPILAEVAWQADRFDVKIDWFELARDAVGF